VKRRMRNQDDLYIGLFYYLRYHAENLQLRLCCCQTEELCWEELCWRECLIMMSAISQGGAFLKNNCFTIVEISLLCQSSTIE
jgi:hypothetical protein